MSYSTNDARRVLALPPLPRVYGESFVRWLARGVVQSDDKLKALRRQRDEAREQWKAWRGMAIYYKRRMQKMRAASVRAGCGVSDAL